MAYTSETTLIGGTKVKIAIGEGKTRTINVYDDSDTEGKYQEVYRVPEASGVAAARIEANAHNLQELDIYLVGLGAIKEGPR